MEENQDPKEAAAKPVKIRPRNVDKSKEGEEGPAEEKSKKGLLPKRSDPEWLAGLRPHEPSKKEEPAATVNGPLPDEPTLAHGPAEDGAVPTADEPDQSRVQKRRKRRVEGKEGKLIKFLRWLGGPGKYVIAGAACVLILAGLAFKAGTAVGFGQGRAALERELAVREARRVYVLPPEARERVDAALMAFRDGRAEETLAELTKITGEYPDVASIRYLAALAAIQAGNPEEALRFARESIGRGEKVADSLVVESIVESQRASLPETEKMGDPITRAQKILEEAIIEDPAAAGPRIELGSLLRYRGQREDAVRELRSAKARLHPVDSHLVIDVTVALIEVEELPSGALEVSEPATDDVRALFPAAYIAMKKDDFTLAKRLLDRCRAVLPADTFLYLVNDPAFRKFSYRDDLKPYFGD